MKKKFEKLDLGLFERLDDSILSKITGGDPTAQNMPTLTHFGVVITDTSNVEDGEPGPIIV